MGSEMCIRDSSCRRDVFGFSTWGSLRGGVFGFSIWRPHGHRPRCPHGRRPRRPNGRRPGRPHGCPWRPGGGASATGAAGDPRAKNLQANAVPGSTTLRMTSDNELARFYLDVTLRKKLNGSLPRVSLGATDVLSSASCSPENNGNVLPSSGETFSEPSALPIKKIGGPLLVTSHFEYIS